jgi:tripartite-type tricarboxylate transporter receptor subunit TctC
MGVVTLALLHACTVIAAQPGPVAAASDRLYTNPAHRWSIRYPGDWTIDSRDTSFVRIHSAADNALCGIHSRAFPFNTVDEFTDSALAHNARFLKDRGSALVILSRTRISLPNDIVGNDVLVEILHGLRSRRIYVLADGRGFVIDCETYAKNWEKLERSFDWIISSFALESQTAASPPLHGRAEAWPAKPLRLVVPYVPAAKIAGVGIVVGEAANLVSFFAPKLETKLGQSVILNYRPGRLGIVGTEAAVRADPDGYTFLYGDLRSIVLSPALDPRPPYDPIKDLVPVIQLSVQPQCVIANSALGAKSVKELLESEKAKVGRLTFASGGNGTPSHLLAEMLGNAAGVRMSHMPAQGLGPAISAVLDARADLIIASCAAVPRSEVAAGKVILLAVTGTARTPQYKDVPTLREAGYPVDLDAWNGIFAPAGTPKEIVERMASEINGIVGSPEGRKWFLQAGFVVTGTTPDEFLAIIKRDSPRWAEVIRASGATRE